ncbi:MAG: hypothetical protein HY360_16850 [Verrucomicrobia bacterium]|nr:hypothetical protein [Verrucomicrobiota bacterium]
MKTSLTIGRHLCGAILVFNLLFIAAGHAADVDVKTYNTNNVAATTFYKGDDGYAVATVTCNNPPVTPQYAWSGDVIPQNAAAVWLQTTRLGLNTATVVVTGTTADGLSFNGSGSADFTVIDGPRCDNPHAVNETLFECHHYASDTEGTACSTIEVIKNVLSGASCDKHPGRTGLEQCNVHVTGQPGVAIQTFYEALCPGGTVSWSLWVALFQGCGTDCDIQALTKACQTTNPGPATQIDGPTNRGIKNEIGNCP